MIYVNVLLVVQVCCKPLVHFTKVYYINLKVVDGDDDDELVQLTNMVKICFEKTFHFTVHIIHTPSRPISVFSLLNTTCLAREQ